MSTTMTDPDGTMTDNAITDKKLREAVIAACRELVQRGLAYGTSGNVSVRRRPTSEWRFHRDVFESRDDVAAVVHTHSPKATSLACTGRGIPAFHHMVAEAKCAESLRSSALTANKMRRTPASSSAAGIFQARTVHGFDYGECK
jgi:hypothetical protein